MGDGLCENLSCWHLFKAVCLFILRASYSNRHSCCLQRERERETACNLLKTNKIMHIYIAGEHPVKNGTKIQSWQGLNILESYYYLRKNTNFERLLHTIPMNFLLDSGAFTFMQGNHGKVDISDYVNGYAEFINKHDIKLFFELDIDSVVGLEKVEQIRNRLEMLTGKKPIPVWHIGRGKQYFLDMCKAYPYVALGGIVSKEITNYEYFPWFISEAHKAGAKIHGLGFTQLASLRRYHFDSVDSTAWLYGNRGGYLYLFNPKATNLMEKITAPAGKGRLKSNESAMHNFKEWVKLSRWAEKNL